MNRRHVVVCQSGGNQALDEMKEGSVTAPRTAPAKVARVAEGYEESVVL